LTEAGASQAQIKVVLVEEANQADEEGKSMPSDLYKIRANLSFSVNPANFASVISKIEFAERAIAVETIKIRNEAVPRVDMQIITYVQQKAQASSDEKPLVSGLPVSATPANPSPETMPSGLATSNLPPASVPTRSPAPLNVQPQTTTAIPAPVRNPFLPMPASMPAAPNPLPLGKNPFMP
jgi:hypothetical protein